MPTDAVDKAVDDCATFLARARGLLAEQSVQLTQVPVQGCHLGGGCDQGGEMRLTRPSAGQRCNVSDETRHVGAGRHPGGPRRRQGSQGFSPRHSQRQPDTRLASCRDRISRDDGRPRRIDRVDQCRPDELRGRDAA